MVNKMVKTINVSFDENDYKQIIKIKGKRSWHDFILGHAMLEKTIKSNKDMTKEEIILSIQEAYNNK